MKKKEAEQLFGKGFVKVNGVRCKFEFSECCGDKDFITITVPTINEYATDAILGEKWFSSTDDEEWEELEHQLPKYIQKMQEQKEIAEKAPLHLERVKDNYNNKIWFVTPYKQPLVLQQKDDHFEIFTLYNEEPDCPINRPIEVDGKIYRPIWSWWLDRGCFVGQITDKEAKRKC